MNQRIEKFARECGAWNQVYDNRTFMIDEHFDIEKFAELIVRECLGIIDEEGSHEGGSIRSMEAIKEHFGVEE
jgi:hypothetical protein